MNNQIRTKNIEIVLISRENLNFVYEICVIITIKKKLLEVKAPIGKEEKNSAVVP
jgi:hypothetical protein